MTFLELCQRLRQEAGISGTGPASITNQTGFNKKIVDWIARAYAEIQNMHSDWRFLWVPATFNTVVGQRDYSTMAMGLTNFRAYDYESFFAYRSGAQRWPLRFMRWEDFREFYRFESPGQPIYFTELPDYSLRFDYLPQSSELVELSYYRKPFVMASDTDTPAWDESLHEILVYKALMYYAANEEAGNIFTDAAANYKSRLLDLERIYYRGPNISMGPLA